MSKIKTQPTSLDLSIFQKCARDDLASHLKYLEGSKDLFIDEELMKPFDLISGATFLRQNGVQKIYKLQQPGGIDVSCNQIIFIVRPYTSRMRLIVDIINFDKKKGIKRSYHIVYTPKRLTTCDLILEKEGVYGDVTIAEYSLDFFQLDDDLLSVEMPQCFKQFYLEEDTTWYNSIARTLVTLQETYGTILNNYCFGSFSRKIFTLMQTMMSDEQYKPPDGAEIGSLIVVDRNLDYASLLCSQLIYEGLIAEMFGIKSSIVDFDKDVIKSEQNVRLKLNSSDRVFCEIRGLHVSCIFPLLSRKAQLIQCGYDKRNDLDSVKDLKQYVSEDLKQLKQEHKSLAHHIGASEAIMSKWKFRNFEECIHVEQCMLYDIDYKECASYVETCINNQGLAINCLRLLCLLSVCKGGLDSKLYNSLKLQYLHSFGFNHILTFRSLKDAGLYTQNNDKRNLFPKIRKKFNLIPKDPEKVNLGASPTDLSYVFGGAYTPFLIKLIEQVSAKGLTGPLEEMLNTLAIDTYQYKHGTSARPQKHIPNSVSTVLVVFLGGCTHTEVNALRFIGKQMGYRFVILTTAVLTASDVLQSLYSI